MTPFAKGIDLKAQLAGDGVALFDVLGTSPITDLDRKNAIARMGIHFGINVAVRDTQTGKIFPSRPSECVDMAREQGWSRERFLDTLNRFLSKPRYATWTPGEFLATDTPRLFGKAWLDKLCADRFAQGIEPEQIMADLEGYLVEGEQLWRIADKSHPLPFERIWPLEQPAKQATLELKPADPAMVEQIIGEIKASLSAEDGDGERG